MIASIGDILIISAVAVLGIAMHPLRIAVVACTLCAALLFAFHVDFVKVPVFRRLHIG